MYNKTTTFDERWIRTGVITGFIATLFYLSLLIPYPEELKRIAFFAYGVFLIPAMIGLYHFFVQNGKKVKLQLATVFGIIGGALVNLMAVVQSSIRYYMLDYIADAPDLETERMLRWI